MGGQRLYSKVKKLSVHISIEHSHACEQAECILLAKFTLKMKSFLCVPVQCEHYLPGQSDVFIHTLDYSTDGY